MLLSILPFLARMFSIGALEAIPTDLQNAGINPFKSRIS